MTFSMLTRNNPTLVIAACALSAALGACGSSAPSQQLVDARRAYNDAAASSAARYTPDDLLTARQALEKAEKAHDDDARSEDEVHLAYLAARKAQIAKAKGEIAEARKAEEQAKAMYQAQLERAATESQSNLAKAANELESEREARTEAELQKQQADRRAAAALQGLREVVEIQQDQRGTVITLTGGLLFGSGKSEVSPNARVRLDQLGDVLAQQPVDKPIQVVGHTDDTGSESTNERLSEKRAQAVADQLIARGIDSERITVEGRGEAEPIASNDTAEGRATNRRVEIILGTAGEAPGMTGEMPPAQRPGMGSSPGTMPQMDEPASGSPAAPDDRSNPQQPPMPGD